MSDTQDPALTASERRRQRVQANQEPLTEMGKQAGILNLNVGAVQVPLTWAAESELMRQLNVAIDSDLSLMVDDIVYQLSRRYRYVTKREVVSAILRYVLEDDLRTTAALQSTIKR